MPSPQYFTGQTQINFKHRVKLIDWLIQIHEKLSLVEETLYLTINLIDRYLSSTDLGLNKLQLLGIASIFLASKYQEIYAPELRDFVHCSDNIYSGEEIVKMETDLLKKLNYKMLIVSPLIFFNRMYFISAGSKTQLESFKYHRMYFIGIFILNLSLLEYNMLKYSPSILASASLFISRKVAEINPQWPKQIMESQGFNTTEAVKDCVQELISLIKTERASSLVSLKKKFSKEANMNVYSFFGSTNNYQVKKS